MNKRSNYLYRACFFVSLSCVFVAAILNLEYAHFLLVWGLEPKWPPETQNTRDKGFLNFYSYFKRMWRLPVRFAHFEEREQRWLFFFVFLFGIKRLRQIITLSKFSWDQEAHWTDFDNWEIRPEGKIFINLYRDVFLGVGAVTAYAPVLLCCFSAI